MALRASAVLAIVGLIAINGCNREEDSTTGQPTATAVATPPGVHAEGDGHGKEAGPLAFVTPEAWQQDPTPRSMREATFLVGTGEKSAEMVVTRLSGNFGDFGSNINRWRGQIGLEPLANTSSVKPRIISTPVGEAKLIKLEGADKASIVAMVAQGGETWFFRLTGELSTVNANEAKLEQMLTSLSLTK